MRMMKEMKHRLANMCVCKLSVNTSTKRLCYRGTSVTDTIPKHVTFF